MSSTLSFLRDSVNDPQFHELFSIIKGFRNGLVLGAKLRLPHALVMSIIHGRGSLAQRAQSIYKATKDHSVGLAQFVALYKLFLFVQIRANGGKETNAATFIAGLIAGWIVFHDQTIVREQIVLYVASRIFAGLLARQPGLTPTSKRATVPPSRLQFRILAAISWAAVVWTYRHHRERLQPGLYNSMEYLYGDSEVWNGWRTLVLRNK